MQYNNIFKYYRFKENVIRQTCETAILGTMYPRTGISLTIQELEDFGGVSYNRNKKIKI